MVLTLIQGHYLGPPRCYGKGKPEFVTYMPMLLTCSLVNQPLGLGLLFSLLLSFTTLFVNSFEYCCIVLLIITFHGAIAVGISGRVGI